MLLRSFSRSVDPVELRPLAWDVALVLQSLTGAPYEPLRTCDERFLAQKTLFLPWLSVLVSSTLCRIVSLIPGAGLRFPFLSSRASWQRLRIPPPLLLGLRALLYRPYQTRDDISHPLQLTTGLVVNSFIITNPTLAGESMLLISKVSIRKNVFWLKQNFIFPTPGPLMSLSTYTIPSVKQSTSFTSSYLQNNRNVTGYCTPHPLAMHQRGYQLVIF